MSTRPSGSSVLEGRLVTWLLLLARTPREGALTGAARGGARPVLSGLVRIRGTRLVLDLADLLASVEGMLERMLDRLARVQSWLPEAELLLVMAVRDDAALTARRLAEVAERGGAGGAEPAGI
jgi:hypothetical protein